MFRFTLRTYLFWFVPYVVVCLLVFTAGRDPMIVPGRGIPMWYWGRFALWGVVTAVWLALFFEDRRALQRARREDADKPR